LLPEPFGYELAGEVCGERYAPASEGIPETDGVWNTDLAGEVAERLAGQVRDVGFRYEIGGEHNKEYRKKFFCIFFLMKTRSFNLRAFRIANDNISKSSNGIKNMLSKKLKGSVSQDRRMLINENDNEEDLLSDFDSNHNCFHGVIFRICPSDAVQNIPNDFFQKEKISITELDDISPEKTNVCKDHYYFSVNDKFLVTNLQKNITISRLQVYINWLLREERAERLFEFAPILIKPENVKLSELKNITFKDTSIHKEIVSQNNSGGIGKKSFDIAKSLLSKLLNDPQDINMFEKIEENQIISAELLIKFSKPRNMSKEDYDKIAGAFVKPISDTDDVIFTTKEGNKITAAALQKTKPIEIELTEQKKINEKQLQQEMEKFLKELQNEESH